MTELRDSLPPAEPWQLDYFAQAIARGACLSEAGGCGGLIDYDQDQLERLARTDEVRLRVLSALRDRAGVSGDKEAERAMLRADAWVSILTCRARKDERSALAWSKWYAELGGVGAPGTEAKPLSAASADQLRESMRQSLRAAGFELVPVAPGDPRG